MNIKEELKDIFEKIFQKENFKNKAKIVIIIYIVAFYLFALKINVYQKNVVLFQDEIENVAYICYLSENHQIIPKFEDMHLILTNKEKAIFMESTVNNLGHPPLYYHILNAIVDVDLNNITQTVLSLRVVSKVITYITILIAFYIGWKYNKRIINHIIYAAVLISMPYLTLYAGVVTNDVLSFTGIAVTLLGMLRISESKRGFLTYLIIAIGIFISFLNKLTVAMMVLIASMIILLYYCIKEKNIKIIWCKQFLVTTPIYIVIAIYYIILLQRYGTINPSLAVVAQEYFKKSYFYVPEDHRLSMNFLQYAKMYWLQFLSYLSGPEIHGVLLLNREPYKCIPIVIAMIIIPIINLIMQRKEKKSTKNLIVYSFFIGMAIAIIVQFLKSYYEFQYVSGYIGAFQTKYYACMAPIIALIMSMWFENLFAKIEKTTNKKIEVISKLCVFFVGIAYVLLLYKMC